MTIYFSQRKVEAWLGYYEVVIAADTDTTLTVPANSTEAVIAAEEPFWVDDQVITLPTASSFGTTTALKNPRSITVTAGDTLHFRSAVSQDIYVAFFR